MAKKAAVLVVDPVNGAGLFHYLEAFFENGIPFRTFAVAETPQVTTNSGVALRLDDTVSRLAGREEEYDALVFACRPTPCPNSPRTPTSPSTGRCSAS